VLIEGDGIETIISCVAKLSSGKTFVVREENRHSWENFHGCMLVLILPIDKAT